MSVVTVAPGMFEDHSLAVESRTSVSHGAFVASKDLDSLVHTKVDTVVGSDPKDALHEADIARV